ncbi:hypothetical protein [Stenotrophomonas maltophilia]|uniref:hypothetical protein n=1 Tax=Stenotrophomonas maltophilia TaxID=40324 RepID=UPI00201000F5|nr:hypothetical protein [Stenotrophomonas maltophilia]UQA72236.1 hypothetical protein K1516_09070 [Stenotrophomonas maltophilia]
MKKLPLPAYDDAAAFVELSKNSRLSSFPDLLPVVNAIKAGYLSYVRAGGNPALVRIPEISERVGGRIKAHYSSPCACLSHIDEMRELTAHNVCPMCGSFHSGTLDHYLPKGDYPAFSIFSANLVPACMCNSKRGNILLGEDEGERVLHPYFDDFLAERLIVADFRCLGDVPRVDIRLAVDDQHPNYRAIRFHVDRLIRRTPILKYLRDRWALMLRRPSLVVRGLKLNVGSCVELRSTISDELEMLDDMHESKNNWMSVFVAGLLEEEVVAWLFDALNNPNRCHDGPLLV